MRHAHPARRLFTTLVRQPYEQIDLIRTALAVASEDCNDVNIKHTLRVLEHIAERSRANINPDQPFATQARQLVEYFHHVEGFAGNSASYDDPSNSYLHHVVLRRKGLPITLSLILLHIGQRLHLPVEPSALPGHFMVRCASEDGILFLDPFNGRVLTSPLCREFLRAQLGYDVPEPERFPPPSRMEVVARLLRNLKRTYFDREHYDLALAATERILIIDPGSAEDVRDRGLLHVRLGNVHRGLWDLEQYAQLEPMAGDIATVRKYAQTLGDTLGRRN